MNNKTLKTWINTHPMKAFSMWFDSKPYVSNYGEVLDCTTSEVFLNVDFIYTEKNGKQHEIIKKDIINAMTNQQKKQILKKYI